MIKFKIALTWNLIESMYEKQHRWRTETAALTYITILAAVGKLRNQPDKDMGRPWTLDN